ncbi:MAG: lamin tail domain-containing protein [Bacteroidales bacterium]|nr:lamin tail domain-containing protein [Bacteroidales bacterium]MCF6342479.1 lamin tail domain-containing protein [Bacteroidales bacterium]
MKKLLLAIFTLFIGSALLAQECSDLFISEYVEGSGNNKAIELYNPTDATIDLSAYKLVRYSNGGFQGYDVGLEGTIEPKDVFVVVLDKRDPNGIDFEQPVDSALQEKADIFLCPVYSVNRMMYFNGNDAVTLEKVTGEIIDIFGIIGGGMLSDDNGWGNLNDTTITYNSGGNPTSYTIQNYIVGPLFWLSWSKDNTLIRKYDIKQGVTSNPDPYFEVFMEWDSVPKDTFDSLGFHKCDCGTLDIKENINPSFVSVYPNPATGNEFTIETTEPVTSVEVIDLRGIIVSRRAFAGHSESYRFTSDRKLQGIYFVRISLASGQQVSKKLVFK